MSIIIEYIVPFLVVLTILVFVHEWGHYWVARRCGVRVEVFSVGFGSELFGFTDRAGTRWKFSVVPLGGYVKFFGDASAASTPDREMRDLPPDEANHSFQHKSVGRRAAIVAAGPAANFIFAIVALAAMFFVSGHPFPPPVIGGVAPGSAAERAGIMPGDRVVSVDGAPVFRFADLALMVRSSGGQPLTIDLARDGERLTVVAAPAQVATADEIGESIPLYQLGVGAGSGPYGLLQSLTLAVEETAALTWMTITAVSEIIAGQRSAEELGGPLRIAQISGDVAQIGIVALVWFMAFLSINLGLINLFPIPMLDGGHLLFYGVEAIRGRPLGERAQEYGFRIGLALVLTLMLLATWNDLVQLRVVAFLQGVIS